MMKANTQGVAEATFGNSGATYIPFRFNTHAAEDCSHTVVVGPTRNGMSSAFEALQREAVKGGARVTEFDKGFSMRPIIERSALMKLDRLRRHGSRKVKVAVRRTGSLLPTAALAAVRRSLGKNR